MAWINQIIDILLEGGFIVWPLLLVMLTGFVIVIERFIFWKKISSTYSTESVEMVYTYLAHKQHDLAKEIYLSSEDPSLLCLKHCLASKGKIHPQILQSLGQQFLDKCKKYMRLLETVISVSPLLGILGTIVGIIFSFKGLGANLNDTQTMMAGLAQALITTALGLVIAIVYLIFYNQFLHSYEKLKSKLERDLSAFESLI